MENDKPRPLEYRTLTEQVPSHGRGSTIRTGCLVASWLFVPILAGHGAGVVALLLFMGWGAWGVPLVLGSSGSVLLVLSEVTYHRLPLVLGISGLAASFVLIVKTCRGHESEVLVGSMPFIVMLIVKVYLDLIRRPR